MFIYQLNEEKRKELLQLLKWSKAVINSNIDFEDLDESDQEMYTELKSFIEDLSFSSEEWSKKWKEE